MGPYFQRATGADRAEVPNVPEKAAIHGRTVSSRVRTGPAEFASDYQPRCLTVKSKALGRRRLTDVASIATPDAIRAGTSCSSPRSMTARSRAAPAA